MKVLYFQLPVGILEVLLRRVATLCSPDQAPQQFYHKYQTQG